MTISESAFEYCSDLESVVFPKDSKLQTIARSAFARSGVKELVCPNSLKEIGLGAFTGCKNLSRVELNENI